MEINSETKRKLNNDFTGFLIDEGLNPDSDTKELLRKAFLRGIVTGTRDYIIIHKKKGR